MRKLSVAQLDLRGRRVFLRGDLNVPLASGEVTDDTRIRAIMPTLQYCLGAGASVVLASHLGRPDGRRDSRLSLAPVLFRLEELLGRPIGLAPDCVGPVCERLAHALEPGQCLLLENLRFHPEEELNDPGFAAGLARLATCYVNDALSVCHRRHASVSGITRFLQPAAAGLLMQHELLVLERIVDNPARPLMVMLGGARVSEKLGLIRHLLPTVDRLAIGGAMAFTFLKARGAETGQSLVEHDLVPLARQILAEAERRRVDVLLPEDVVIATCTEQAATMRCWPADRLPVAMRGLDIGPATVAKFRDALRGAATVFWNGPVGVCEHPPFDAGTAEIARALAEHPGLTVVAGSDTAAAARRAGVADGLGYLSTAGAAFLEALEGRELPGVTALSETH